MNKVLEWLQNASELIKFIAPLAGLGSSGVALFKTTLGGKRMFGAFASQYDLTLTDANMIDAATFVDWGKQIINTPVDRISESSVFMLLFYIFSFVTLFFLLSSHLLAKNKEEQGSRFARKYQQHHSHLTISIYVAFLVVILCCPGVISEFLALFLFILFFSVHMFMGIKDIQRGNRSEKLAWIFSWLSLALILIFLPSVYGKKYFSPDVHVVEAFDDRQNIVDVIRAKSITVFFSMPGERDEEVIGILQHRTADGMRTLKILRQPILKETGRTLLEKPAIALGTLLSITHSPAFLNPDTDEIKDKVQKELKGQTQESITHGYSMPD